MQVTKAGYRFEQFVTEILRAEAAQQRKVLLVGNEIPKESIFADALAPHGIFELPGPTYIAIKQKYSVGVREWIRYTFRRVPIDASVLLVIESITASGKKELETVEKEYPGRVRVLQREDIRTLARNHPDAALAFESEYLLQAIELYRTRQEEPLAQNSHIAALSTAYQQDRVALFLGAGVSASAKFPDWKRLLKSLALDLFQGSVEGGLHEGERDKVFEYFQSQLPESPIIVARLLRDTLGETFPSRVRKALYDGTSETATSPLIHEIGALCMPGRNRAGLPAVVTYNFDDLLETELTRREVDHCVVLSDEDDPLPHQLPIYHVHGFLPRKGTLSEQQQKSLVLSEEAYHWQYTDPYMWANIVPLNLLRHKVCLFVGLSMTDPNLRRLLEITREQRPSVRHYAILPDHWGVAEGETPLGAKLASLPSVFKGLEEASFAKLGVSVIWAKDYAEVPVVLSQIRTGA
jgi:hypothetical protein